MLADFEMRNDLLFYKDKSCVPHKSVKNISQLARDFKIGGSFSHTKSSPRNESFFWKGKSKDVDLNCKGCMICQTSSDSRTKPLVSTQPLEIPDR